MSPEKCWYKEFKRQIEKNGLIVELEVQRKYTTSWTLVKFNLSPADTAESVIELLTSVNGMLQKHIIDQGQAHVFIKDVLLKIFCFQFDVFFILTE